MLRVWPVRMRITESDGYRVISVSLSVVCVWEREREAGPHSAAKNLLILYVFLLFSFKSYIFLSCSNSPQNVWVWLFNEIDVGLCGRTGESLLYFSMALKCYFCWNPDSFFNIWIPGLKTDLYPEALDTLGRWKVTSLHLWSSSVHIFDWIISFVGSPSVLPLGCHVLLTLFQGQRSCLGLQPCHALW